MKKFLTLMLLMGLVLIGYAQTSFITIWDTGKLSGTYVGATNLTIKLPVTGGTYSGNWFKVGEPATNGTFTNVSLTNNIIPVPSAGIYEVTISNVGVGFYWQIGSTSAETDRRKLMEVKQWGDLWTWDKTFMFNDCLNLQVTATDAPKLAGSLQSMFKDCTYLTGNASFNTWDVSSVTNMNGMFYGAKAFNQPLNNWNTGSVQNMADMFRSTDAFNQPIGNWNTSSVTAMTNMFETSKAFNQSLATWNVSNVTNLNGMFFNSVFNNASLGNWTLKAGVTMGSFLGSSNNIGMDCINFSNTLKGWADNSNTPSGLTLGAAQRFYGDQDSYDKLRTEKGWAINNANYDAACAIALPVSFAGLSASVIDGKISVKWKTISESNNDHFVIYLSKDGENWQEITKVASKGENGNSDGVLEYQHTFDYQTSLQQAGVPMLITLVLAVLLFNRRKRLLISMVLITGVFFAGCSKDDLKLEETTEQTLYIKITQIDKDGTTSSDSDVVSVKSN